MTLGQAHRSLREEVVDELRRLILAGELAAGTRLKEEAAAERLGVSRLPIREAFRRLEAEGLLQSTPRRGVVVTPPSDSEIQVVHAVRVALELLAVELAAARQDPQTMETLRQSLSVGRAAAEADDQQTLSQLNAEFHELLGQGSGSPYLAGLLRSVRNQVHHLVGGWHTAPDLSWKEHASIVQAVLDQDSATAVTLMREHLDSRHEVSTRASAAGQ
jgi:DNA-binding GntR family transcriptional regulator